MECLYSECHVLNIQKPVVHPPQAQILEYLHQRLQWDPIHCKQFLKITEETPAQIP